jgi:hypothetical protein
MRQAMGDRQYAIGDKQYTTITLIILVIVPTNYNSNMKIQILND